MFLKRAGSLKFSPLICASFRAAGKNEEERSEACARKESSSPCALELEEKHTTGIGQCRSNSSPLPRRRRRRWRQRGRLVSLLRSNAAESLQIYTNYEPVLLLPSQSEWSSADANSSGVPRSISFPAQRARSCSLSHDSGFSRAS